jgi:hypothetical protein
MAEDVIRNAILTLLKAWEDIEEIEPEMETRQYSGCQVRKPSWKG